MSNFTFDEESHTYRLDGVKLPSVTEVIDYAFDSYACVSKELMARAREWGQAVHKVVELHLKDDLDEENMDELLQGPLKGFKQWRLDYPTICLYGWRIETPGYHPRLKYAGTPDLEGDAVIDLKSRKVDMLKDSIQTTSYDHMTGNGKRDKYVLELKQDGTYEFTNVTPTKKSMEQAWCRWRYLLDYYKMGREIELWKN